ncbi:lipopolysaccharide biosynthesis protein [Rhizobium lemnae]|nr:lipopolysaccharide biosynthesis protein [Rhizobium lemnae]MCJ8510593.1 lipopolysaccharide biosynthesis protein [Rhizobium lemnae]
MGFGHIVRTAASVAQILVLSRILQPADFGIVAVCAPIVAFIALFQDPGLGQAAIQKEHLTSGEASLLFWIDIGIGLVLGVILMGAAPAVGAFYEDKRITSYLMATCITFVVAGGGVQHEALLAREMRFDILAVNTAISGILGLVAAVVAGLYDFSYWSLYIGSFVTTFFYVVGLWSFSKWRPGWPKKTTSANWFMSFGMNLTGFNVVNFFARNLDGLLVGRYWGLIELGHYDRANRLLLAPLTQVMAPLYKVMIPVLSRLNSQPDRYRDVYIRTLAAALILILPGIAFATATSDVLIAAVLGPRWDYAAQIFSVLGIAGLLQAMNNPAGWLFITQGRTKEFFRWGLVSSLLVVAAFFVGLRYGGIGVAVAYVVAEYIKTPLLWMYVGRRGPVRTLDIASAVGPLQLAAHLSLAATWLVHFCLPSVAALLFSLVTCVVTFFAIVIAFPRTRRLTADIIFNSWSDRPRVIHW